MPRIKVLPEEIANRIAAGEVVERPASVVKELLENSLDAGARRISVRVEEGGVRLIRVADDGSGMSREDALLSLERHATSKIVSAEDIFRIATLGFRGEALPSIASVSEFEMVTREEGTLEATRVRMRGGRLIDVKETAAPVGTTVTVRRLFFNTPARRKFLRSRETETRHIVEAFLLYCLDHPEIHLRLEVEGRPPLVAPPAGTLRERVSTLFGPSFAEDLVPVKREEEGMDLTGFAGKPSLSRKDRKGILLFVNGRPVRDVSLSLSVREAYGSLLPEERFPSLILFISLDPVMVDVNIHPTKREVRFSRLFRVRRLVSDGVRDALRGAELAPEVHMPEREAVPYDVEGAEQTLFPVAEERVPYAPLAEPQTPPEGNLPFGVKRIVGQVARLYIAAETEEGLLLFDQHAAHERVLYEKVLSEWNRGELASQSLLIPLVVELPPAEASAVKAHRERLCQLGLSITEFGPRSFSIESLPRGVENVDGRRLLLDLAGEIEEGEKSKVLAEEVDRRLLLTVCRRAVKASDPLPAEGMASLLRDLSRTETPNTCPHGRPTFVRLSWKELEKQFKRT